MFVPFNVADFLERAATVYSERVGVIDEPDQPAESWGSLSFEELARRAKAQAAGLDVLGVGRANGWRWYPTTAPGSSPPSPG